MKFDRQLRPDTETSWVVSFGGKTIPRWQTAAILKIILLPYLSGKSQLKLFSHGTGTLVPADGNGDYQTLICVFVARPRRCLTLSNPVTWQNCIAAYLGYTLRMRTLFRGWPIMVNDTHTRRSGKSSDFDEILYTAADFELDERHVIKNEKVALDRLRVRQNILFDRTYYLFL